MTRAVYIFCNVFPVNTTKNKHLHLGTLERLSADGTCVALFHKQAFLFTLNGSAGVLKWSFWNHALYSFIAHLKFLAFSYAK